MGSQTLALFFRALRADVRLLPSHLMRLGLIAFVLITLLWAQATSLVMGAPGLLFFTQLSYINLGFATLAFTDEPSLIGLGLVVSADNFAYQFAGTAFIAYLSGLTNTAYTATQYALFSSIFALPGKLVMGGSGFVAQAVGWPWFFVYTSALGIPALLLLALLTRRLPAPPSLSASPRRT